MPEDVQELGNDIVVIEPVIFSVKVICLPSGETTTP